MRLTLRDVACLCFLSFSSLLWAEVSTDDPVAQQNAKVPRISCDVPLSKEQTLSRGLVEGRIKAGQLYAAYAEVMALPPTVAEIAILRADILRRLGRPEAYDWFRALQKTCMSGLAEYGLGLLAANDGHYAEARESLLQAVRQMPTDARVRNDLGYVLILLNQDTQAMFELRIAAELAPENRLPVLNLLLLSLLQGNEKEWAAGVARWQPTASERSSLAKDCRSLYATRVGIVDGAKVDCPINKL